MDPLPHELWVQIVQQVLNTKPDWLALSLTCRFLRTIAQAALYKHIRLYEKWTPQSVNHPRVETTLLYRSLRERRDLAELVHCLSVYGHHTRSLPSMHPLFSHPLLSSIASFSNLSQLCVHWFHIDALTFSEISRLPRLVKLEIYACSVDDTLCKTLDTTASSTRSNFEQVFLSIPHGQEGWGGIIPPGLRTLSLLNASRTQWDKFILETTARDCLHSLTKLYLRDTRDLPSNFFTFLISAPNLRKIVLPYYNNNQNNKFLNSLPAHAIPLLENFCGPTRCLERFIHGRPVHTAKIQLEIDTPTDVLLALTRGSTVPVTKLTLFGTNAITAGMLHHAPATLRIFKWSDHDVRTILSWFPALSNMPDLRVLRHAKRWRPYTAEEQDILVSAAAAACRALREYEFDVCDFKPARYHTWRVRRDGAWTFERSNWVSLDQFRGSEGPWDVEPSWRNK